MRISNASFLAVNISTSICNILKFLYNGTLSTTYNGARVVLWANQELPTSVDWYGLGMTSNAIYYNTGTSSKHSFQVTGTEHAYINSNGITASNSNITTMNCSTLVINDSTGNALQVGTGPNAWLFNTYPYVALNGCF